MNLLLTSDFPSTESQVAIDEIRRFGNNPRIAWLPSCKQNGREHFSAAKEQFEAKGFGNVEYCDISQPYHEPKSDFLSEYDIIYLAGGNPIEFRNSIEKSELPTDLRRYLERGSLVIGASGGAMQLAKNVSLFRLMTESVHKVLAEHKDFISISIVDFEFLPHLNRFDSIFMNKVRKYSEGVDCEIIAVGDGGAVVHNGDGFHRFVGKAVKYSNGVLTDIGTEK